MARLLVVQPDSAQVDTLREALSPYIDADVVVACSLDEALAWIDHCLPDVIILPTLMPAMVEDYLIAYLATIPNSAHVQILGMHHLERAEVAVERDERPRRFLRRRPDWSLRSWRPDWSVLSRRPDWSLRSWRPDWSLLSRRPDWSRLSWRRRRQPMRHVGTPVCDPGVFSKDVVSYLAAADALRRDFDLVSPDVLSGTERRIEQRFGYDELPWISYVRMGDEQAALINLSAGGALLRMSSRPEHRFLRRADPHVAQQARLTLEVGSLRQVHALGRVIRCVPVIERARTQYVVAFAFDDRAARAEGILEKLELPRQLGAGTEIVLAR